MVGVNFISGLSKGPIFYILSPNMKTRLLYFTFCLFSFILLASCGKMDCNDGLDGQWQMTEWTSPDGEVLGGKEMEIYYSFQLEMMMFQRLSISSALQFSSFENCGTHIRIYDPIKYAGAGHDEILPMGMLAPYGVPSDGIMQVETLSGSRLVLSSKEMGKLTFRKY